MNNKNILPALEKVLQKHIHERVCVLGTTCTGKSTLVKEFQYAIDMDEVVFPLLSKEERTCVCQSPWTEKIGETMTKLVKEKIKIQPGKPVFGTVLLECDYAVYLKISDALLKERAKKRGHSYEDAKNMQMQIEKEIKNSNIPYKEIAVS